MADSLDYSLQLDVVSAGYDRKTCWVHARAGIVPPSTTVLTAQKLRLTGSDVFYAVNEFRSNDFGRTWAEPVEHETLGRRPVADGVEECPSGLTSMWHAATGKLLLTGATVPYKDDEVAPQHARHHTAYSVYDPEAQVWSGTKTLDLPDSERFYHESASCTQRVDLADGTILLPIDCGGRGAAGIDASYCFSCTVLRCEFDGEELRYVEHGDDLVCSTPRGFAEPSLAQFGGRFWLTIRNDVTGYVACGSDGLHFDEARPWTFDDGTELGSYNTQQHWVTHSDGLFLVYTRRGAGNGHVFRHRAPLFMAQVDPDRVCVIRDSERIVVPEHGARLGNFGTVNASRGESWVVVSEWMQTHPPAYHDSTVCERYGSDNRIFISRIKWHRPNQLVAWSASDAGE